MKVYLAAPWVEKELARAVAPVIEAAGHTITEKWWEHPEVEGYPIQGDDAELCEQAGKDLHGVLSADAVIVLNPRASEGKAVEQGIAIAMCTPIVVVGKRSNIFHYLPGVRFADSVTEALEML